MHGLEALVAFNNRRAREERERAERAANARDRALHLEMASIFAHRADERQRLLQ
ncbi:hypothetical protein [Sphingomonas sp. LM7]|uniref:hypothetical protein n=1 Tax=Sphingomonas sp. LM7 TaxID=1938607 RepID=UPI0015C52917|nr:hypothetical protein [Sphingomonas sp. LM7]